METFAKLFQIADIGQVLVKLDEEDKGPEVRIYFMPEGLGVCSTTFSYPDDETESAWAKAEAAFEKVDEQMAAAIVCDLIKIAPKSGGQ